MTRTIGTPPFFSIVTIVRNNADGLARTAESIIEQRFKNYEWIIVDGGSTDATLTVIERYRDRIESAVSEPDKGIYDAMNKGLRRSRGEYVNYMNAGDAFATPDALAAVYAKVSGLEERPTLIYGSSLMDLGGGRHIVRRVKAPASYILHGLPALHQAIFFERLAHLKVPYPDEFAVCGDYAVVGELMRRGSSWATVSDLISLNEIGGDSFSFTHADRMERDINIIQRDVLKVPRIRRFGSWARRRLARAVIGIASA